MDLIYKREKDDEDINLLIMQHKNLVYYMLSRMRLLSDPDAESAGYEALWDAVLTFDVYSTSTFGSYACVLIKNKINDMLRVRKACKRSLYATVELTEDNTLFTFDEVASLETADTVYRCFDKYINKEGVLGPLARNILLAWYAAGFEMSVTDLAKYCSTTPSYVSRVQCSFRAYLAKYLL